MCFSKGAQAPTHSPGYTLDNSQSAVTETVGPDAKAPSTTQGAAAVANAQSAASPTVPASSGLKLPGM